MDSRYRPMSPELTCVHLEVGTTSAGRFYARCAVGTAADRLAWQRARTESQLADLEALQQSINARTAALVDSLWDVKGRQLRAFSTANPAEGVAATEELRRQAESYLTGVEAVLEDEHQRLHNLGLTVPVSMDLLRDLLNRWVTQRSAEPPEISDADLRRFPEQAWWLFRPRAAAPRRATDRAPGR